MYASESWFRIRVNCRRHEYNVFLDTKHKRFYKPIGNRDVKSPVMNYNIQQRNLHGFWAFPKTRIWEVAS